MANRLQLTNDGDLTYGGKPVEPKVTDDGKTVLVKYVVDSLEFAIELTKKYNPIESRHYWTVSGGCDLLFGRRYDSVEDGVREANLYWAATSTGVDPMVASTLSECHSVLATARAQAVSVVRTVGSMVAWLEKTGRDKGIEQIINNSLTTIDQYSGFFQHIEGEDGSKLFDVIEQHMGPAALKKVQSILFVMDEHSELSDDSSPKAV